MGNAEQTNEDEREERVRSGRVGIGAGLAEAEGQRLAR